MEKTKFVTVYWSEIKHMKSVIEVDINEDDEELMFQQACLGGSISPRVIECEIERDSIEMVEGLDLENE